MRKSFPSDAELNELKTGNRIFGRGGRSTVASKEPVKTASERSRKMSDVSLTWKKNIEERQSIGQENKLRTYGVCFPTMHM